MTIINFDLTDSAGRPLTGHVLVTLDYPLDAPDLSLALPAFARVDLVNGLASVDLAPSEVARVSYRFQVYWLNGTPAIETLLYDIRTLVPNSAAPVNFSELAQETGVTRDTLPSYRQAIARSLYSDEDFWVAFSQHFFRHRGQVVASAFYRRGDVVIANSGAYLCIASQQVLGSTVSQLDKWVQVGFQGAQGTGTSGSLDANPTSAWNDSTVALSQGSFWSMLASLLATKAEVNAKLTTGDPLPSGTTLANSPALGNSSNLVTTTGWVQQTVAAIDRIPVGATAMWFTAAAPTRWLFANGQTVSRTTYSALFALFGTSFNTGGEATTVFRLPNYVAPGTTPANARWIIFAGA